VNPPGVIGMVGLIGLFRDMIGYGDATEPDQDGSLHDVTVRPGGGHREITVNSATGFLDVAQQRMIVRLAAELGLQWQRGQTIDPDAYIVDDSGLPVAAFRFFVPRHVLTNGPRSTIPLAIHDGDVGRPDFTVDRVAYLRREFPDHIGHVRLCRGEHPETFRVAVRTRNVADPRRRWHDVRGNYYRDFEIQTWTDYLDRTHERAIGHDRIRASHPDGSAEDVATSDELRAYAEHLILHQGIRSGGNLDERIVRALSLGYLHRRITAAEAAEVVELIDSATITVTWEGTA
jgi:hypothetical protein